LLSPKSFGVIDKQAANEMESKRKAFTRNANVPRRSTEITPGQVVSTKK
jgi:hypothetical protein